jgi:aspartate/methionine/tyrosine aminotransferase
MKPVNPIFAACRTTIFSVMSALAREYEAINLGQGFPDEEGPLSMREVAAAAGIAGPNQYPPMQGLPALREAVARHDKRCYGLDLDWQTEVLITSGATEALAAACFGLIAPDDEVVLIEPVYDAYLPLVQRAGGIPRLVRLRPPGWELPRDALSAAFSASTKLLILNSPHNPTGKVFDADELSFIAGLLEECDAYAVCDEVYEHIVFDDRAHRPLSTLPGVRGRCLRIGSAGKTFSMTGWKVGYVVGAAPLIEAAAKAHQFLTFTTPPNLQAGVAHGLDHETAWIDTLGAAQQAKRDRLATGLRAAAFDVLPSQGTYFLTARIPDGWTGSDDAFCRYLTTEAGVACIPLGAFYEHAEDQGYIRFCFCKRDEVLDEAVNRLSRYFTEG